MLRGGECGELLSISGTIWQRWGPGTMGKWRQVPEISGGGFMFDTGAHLLNTVADLAGEDFVEVAAWTDNRGVPWRPSAAVDRRGWNRARWSRSTAAARTVRACESDIRVFCDEAIRAHWRVGSGSGNPARR